MILVENTVISDDIAENFFVCHIEKCKGACCVEGDSGAPLEPEELEVLSQIYPLVKDYLTPEGRAAIEATGTYTTDDDDDYVTPLAENKACAYAITNEQGILKCGIEQAWLDGKIPFRKPVSCHLYPIRITRYDDFDAINYHRWHICEAACSLGEKLGVPLYQFLKEALIRKYGQAWFRQLEREIDERQLTARPSEEI
jgi:hypothetical protein